MADDIIKDSVLSLFNPFQTGFEYVLSQIVYVAVTVTIVIGCVCLSIFCEKNHLSAKAASKDRRVISMLARDKLITKKLLMCITFLIISVYAGCSQSAVSFNNLSNVVEGAARYIEDSYYEEMDISEFKELTGIDIQKRLPNNYQTSDIFVYTQYGKDGGIINISMGISEVSNGAVAGINAYSDELWSELSYSPVEYYYGNEDTNDYKTTQISSIETVFFHYDDSKAKENKLGYDVFITEFIINDINVYVESSDMSKEEFKQFVTSIIETAEPPT